MSMLITLIIVFGVWAIFGLFFISVLDYDKLGKPTWSSAILVIVGGGPCVWIYGVWYILFGHR